MRISRVLVCCLIFLTQHYTLKAQARNNDHSFESAIKFVQQFYDWYAPGAVQAADRNGEFDLERRASDLDPILHRALREDKRAQAKAAEIVGIDFDPFLSGQDPCAPYKARKVTQRASHYFVDVDADCENVTVKRPTVTAELVRRNARWIFVNFHYPDPKPHGSDLLSILRENRDARQRSSK